jgi:hypothetical protein
VASIFDDFIADAQAILDEVGKDVTVKVPPSGTPVVFKAMITQPMVLQDMDTGGFLNQTTFEVKFLRTAFAANPGVIAYGHIVTYSGQEYRIVALADRPPSAWVIARVQTKVQ